MADRLLRTREVAALLGAAEHWVRTEAAAGRLPAVPCGGDYLFSFVAVERALIARAGGALDWRDARGSVCDGR